MFIIGAAGLALIVTWGLSYFIFNPISPLLSPLLGTSIIEGIEYMAVNGAVIVPLGIFLMVVATRPSLAGLVVASVIALAAGLVMWGFGL